MYMITTLRELNRRGYHTIEQLRSWKKFDGKYLDTHPQHMMYRPKNKFVTVFAVRGVSDEPRENHELVEHIDHHSVTRNALMGLWG